MRTHGYTQKHGRPRIPCSDGMDSSRARQQAAAGARRQSRTGDERSPSHAQRIHRGRHRQERVRARGSPQREHHTTWQSCRTAAGVKPLTNACLRGRCNDWHLARDFHGGPEPRGSTPKAVYTTAARPPAGAHLRLPRCLPSGLTSQGSGVRGRRARLFIRRKHARPRIPCSRLLGRARESGSD